MGLTARGTAIQQAGALPPAAAYWFDLLKGLPWVPADVRGKDTVAPGRRGRYPGNRVDDTRRLLLEGYIRGVGSTPAERSMSWADNCNLILPLFAMDGNPWELAVSPGTENYLGLATPATIQVRTLDIMEGPIRSRMSYQEFSIELISIDPDWVIEEESS